MLELVQFDVRISFPDNIDQPGSAYASNDSLPPTHVPHGWQHKRMPRDAYAHKCGMKPPEVVNHGVSNVRFLIMCCVNNWIVS